MKAIGGALDAPLKALGLVPKLPSVPKAGPPVGINDAENAAQKQDALFARRGGAADQLTGASGAEAGSTSRTTLG